MPITDFLTKNADFYPNDVALVEINPKLENQKHLTWREYSLIVTSPNEAYRREITWSEFNKKANRFANLLLSRGIKKGDKVAILLMNCLDVQHLFLQEDSVIPLTHWLKILWATTADMTLY